MTQVSIPSKPALAVAVSRVIAADPATLYAAVSDVASIGERSPETVSATWAGPQRGVGAHFSGRNRIGWLSWTTVCTVTRDRRGEVFGFETSAPSRTTWTYEFEPVAGGTLVTESMVKIHPQPAIIRLVQRLAGVQDRAEHLRAAMSETLRRLDAAATGE
jgi:hypothetical protein